MLVKTETTCPFMTAKYEVSVLMTLAFEVAQSVVETRWVLTLLSVEVRLYVAVSAYPECHNGSRFS